MALATSRLGVLPLAFGLSCGATGAPSTNEGGARDAAQKTSSARTAGADASGNVNLVWRSSGCGKSLPANQAQTVVGEPTGYTRFQVTEDGATPNGNDPAKAITRTFWVRVPADYDPNTALRVVYIGRLCGEPDNASLDPMTLDSYYGLFKESLGGSEEAIYVALTLPGNLTTPGDDDCYDTVSVGDSEEPEAFQLIHSFVDENFCVDDNRIFVVHVTSDHAASLASMLGCYFGGIQPTRAFGRNFAIRGQATVWNDSLSMFPQPSCNGPVAGILIRDALAAGQNQSAFEARDRFLAANHCAGSAAVTWPSATWVNAGEPPPCVQYVDCPTEYPVVVCKTVGQLDATANPQAAPAISAFRRFFDTMNPAP